mmetsp:Transcript_8496/g.35482  ORF Transcript_8496/g.35482 Transcript_8496/m.35482 type:complete len:246 (-) Transcript_8496:1822-2559(-)
MKLHIFLGSLGIPETHSAAAASIAPRGDNKARTAAGNASRALGSRASAARRFARTVRSAASASSSESAFETEPRSMFTARSSVANAAPRSDGSSSFRFTKPEPSPSVGKEEKETSFGSTRSASNPLVRSAARSVSFTRNDSERGGAKPEGLPVPPVLPAPSSSSLSKSSLLKVSRPKPPRPSTSFPIKGPSLSRFCRFFAAEILRASSSSSSSFSSSRWAPRRRPSFVGSIPETRTLPNSRATPS